MEISSPVAPQSLNLVRGAVRRGVSWGLRLGCLLGALLFPFAARAENPIIQTKFTADPAPLLVGDRLYLYTSHDDDNATGFTMYNWLLYSTTDMVNWTDHGIIAGVQSSLKTFKWADGNNAWAPQVIARNGKFYLYIPTPKSGHMVIGVAVADQPTGPFVDPVGAPLVDDPSSSTSIDPTVFIDDDGQAYLYYGHQPQLYYVKLNQDMISYSGKIMQVTRPQTFEEGPWFYKRGANYYLAFASTCCPEGIGHAMSTSPTGPWTYKGSVMDGNAASSGNHPGIVDYKGHSYVFGFNYALNAALTTTHRERRSVCVQEFNYAADGSIPKLPFWTSAGVTQLGHLNPFVQTEAETMAWSQGLKTDVCNEGGMEVTAIENGDYLEVKGVDFGAGATSLDLRVAGATSGGTVEARLDSVKGTLIASCPVAGAGGSQMQTWVTKTCAVTGAQGVHDLYFVFTGGTGSLFNFNWWKFSGPGATDAADGGTGSGGRDGSAVDGGTIDAGGGGRTGSGGQGPGPGQGGGAGRTATGGSATGGITGSGGAGIAGANGTATGGRSTGGVATGGATATGGSSATGGSPAGGAGADAGAGCSCDLSDVGSGSGSVVFGSLLLFAGLLGRKRKA